MRENKLLSTKNVVLMGMFGALAGVLMIFEIPLIFVAPAFYGLDFSEIPVLIGTFALGPVAGMIIEVVKILVKLMLKPTSTGFVGEFANLMIGISLILPAGLIYHFKKNKKGAIAGMAVGTVSMTIVGVVLNALVMIPFYSNFMPIESIIEAGAVINPAVGTIWSLAILCVGPFNLIKATLVSLATALVYKRISKKIHEVGRNSNARKSSIKSQV